MKRDTGEKVVKTFAVLSWIEAAMLLLVGIGLFIGAPLLAGPLGDALGAGAMADVLGGIGIGAAVLLTVMGLIYLINGFGLWKHNNWARVLTLVLGVLSLFAFPVGTIVGIITIWLFGFSEAVKNRFHSRAGTRG